MIPYVVGAIRLYLLADSEVNAITEGRIYGGELPRVDVDAMPRTCIVLRSAGGPGERGTLPIGDERIDMRCYGLTNAQAFAVYRTAFMPMKYIERLVQGDAFVHSASLEVGPLSLKEPDGDWPFIVCSWLVKYSQVVLSTP